MVLQAIATELLVSHMKSLPADQRQAAIERMTADVTANGKHVVDMAPKEKLDGARFIQAAASRQMAATVTEVIAAIGAAK